MVFDTGTSVPASEAKRDMSLLYSCICNCGSKMAAQRITLFTGSPESTRKPIISLNTYEHFQAGNHVCASIWCRGQKKDYKGQWLLFGWHFDEVLRWKCCHRKQMERQADRERKEGREGWIEDTGQCPDQTGWGQGRLKTHKYGSSDSKSWELSYKCSFSGSPRPQPEAELLKPFEWARRGRQAGRQ